MTFRLQSAVTILFLGTLPTPDFAQGCCSVNSPSVGVQDQDPVPQGHATFGFSYAFTEASEPYQDNKPESDPLNRKTSLHRGNLLASVGITRRFSAGFALPWVDKSRDLTVQISGGGEQSSSFSASGLGDLSLYGRFVVLPINASIRREASLSAGIKFPTGSYREEQNGSRLELDLQPGTGSYSIFSGFSLYHGFRRPSHLALLGNASYQWHSENPDGYVIGQEFNYGIGAGWLGILSGLDFILQARGRYAPEDRLDGNKLAATGGHLLYAAPSLHCRLLGKFSAAVSASIPVYRCVNGLQVTPSYGLSAIVRYDFSLWKVPNTIEL